MFEKKNNNDDEMKRIAAEFEESEKIRLADEANKDNKKEDNTEPETETKSTKPKEKKPKPKSARKQPSLFGEKKIERANYSIYYGIAYEEVIAEMAEAEGRGRGLIIEKLLDIAFKELGIKLD